VVGDLDGEEVTAQNGRYGPYLRRGTDSRSLESEDQLFTITLDQARALYAQPKARGRGRAAAGPLRELGADPTTGAPVVLRDGRFGPYVTDGETNATLRKGDALESVTLERAVELLAEKRAKGPAPKKRAAAAKKAPAKKTAKNTAKKTGKKTAKKTAKKPPDPR
jgi:DNA topoisomerase I